MKFTLKYNQVLSKNKKKTIWVVFVILCLSIGLYPLTFLFVDSNYGFLALKGKEFLTNNIWYIGFYLHIFPSGLALLIGWSLFIKKFRNKRLDLHKLIGKVYIISILIGGVAGLYLGVHASGGILAKLGFSGMAIAWLYTTYQAYVAIRNKQISSHEKWMIRSYALTFAGVTFRLWLPFLRFGVGLPFLETYIIDSWICWVPNLIIAEIWIRNMMFNVNTVVKRI